MGATNCTVPSGPARTGGTMSWILFVVFAVMAAYTARRMVRDIRRLNNAGWFGASIVAGMLWIASLGGDPLIGVTGFLFAVAVITPVLIVALMILLLANGLVMLQNEGTRLGNLLSLLLGLGLAAMLVIVPIGILHPIALTVVGAIWLVAAYFGAALVGYLLYGGFYLLWARRKVRQMPTSAVVVLGSGIRGEKVTPLLARRIDRGLEIHKEAWDRGQQPLLVMSGGKGSDEQISEAEAMKRYAVSRGLEPVHVLTEDRSSNTEQNLRFTDELITARALTQEPERSAPTPAVEQPQMVLVTNNFHAPRAAALASRLGLPAQAVGAPTAAYYLPSAILREYVAMLREHKLAHVIGLACGLAVIGGFVLLVISL
ncbi:hypothetical protein CGZ91_06065 [Parenemella sanctibonifatiensis]|uniref:DUF218 domain-containing protein n=2 Tax=Parenemella sanctibonifatiensis TaxID=2016505 RepID=A0A255ENJ1_9ACTN|nr:hypothetical protein CGZ91_06065 [Parenemella sanctibonifatiensis]